MKPLSAITRLLQNSRSFRILYCLCAGALMNLALPPVGLWPFVFAGISLFYIFLARVKTTASAALYGWIFGFGYFAAGLWWIANALLVEGNPFSWVWPLAIAGLPALLALFTAAGSAFIIHYSRISSLSGFFAFVAALAVSEWLRGHVFTGFPWNLYGYSWSGWLAMSQSAALGGSYFLTLMTIFWCALPGYLLIAPSSRTTKTILLAVGLFTFGANALYGYIRLSNTDISYHADIVVRPVQPDISQADKWNREKTAGNFANLLDLTAPAESPQPALTIIIWPETAMPDGALEHPQARHALRSALAGYEHDVYLLAGWIRYERGDRGKEKFFNSLAVLDRDLNLLSTYDKAHLVPFGEYVPLQDILAIAPFVRLAGFTPGKGLNTISVNSIPPFSPLICYEVIFPGAVKSQSAKKPAWLLNITNDAWYGDSPGPYQHFAQARFRAIEEGIAVVRAANTGISGVIDPLGQVIAKTGLFKKSAPDIKLPRALETPTFYSSHGDLVFWLGVGLAILAAVCFGTRLNRI